MNPWDHQFGRYDEVWTSLYEEGDFVGFRKEVAGVQFYSSDGYIWSGTKITFDKELAETGIRDRGDRRVFHGDWVILPARTSEQKPRKVVILNHPRWGVLCWMPGQDWILPASSVFATEGQSSSRPKVAQVVGSIHSEPELALRAERLLTKYDPEARASSLDVFTLVVAMLLFGGSICGLQMLLWGAVGPLMTCFGCVAGALAYFFARRRKEPDWLVRSRLMSLARKSSFVLSLVIAGLYSTALLMELKGLEDAIAHPFGAITGIAVVGWVLCFVVIVLSGDTVAWITGGYNHDSSRPSS